MQQYFVAGQAQDVVTITDKDTVKHMFNVMRLIEDEEVVLVLMTTSTLGKGCR